jgi:hypothetical protein
MVAGRQMEDLEDLVVVQVIQEQLVVLQQALQDIQVELILHLPEAVGELLDLQLQMEMAVVGVVLQQQDLLQEVGSTKLVVVVMGQDILFLVLPLTMPEVEEVELIMDLDQADLVDQEEEVLVEEILDHLQVL